MAFTPEQAGALRDDISTDEISPLPAMVHVAGGCKWPCTRPPGM